MIHNIEKIKNIIFDVGDVLLEYRWRDMLTDYGLSLEEAERLGQTMFSDPLWRLWDMGTVPDEEIIREYGQRYPGDGEIIRWFMTHGEYMHVRRPLVWEQVHRLKEKGYGIYILSNYSESLFRKHTEGASFLEDADGAVVSYQIHIAKPSEGIYRYLLQKYHLLAQECLFFDDREENTQAARDLGIEAVTVLSQTQLLQELSLL